VTVRAGRPDARDDQTRLGPEHLADLGNVLAGHDDTVRTRETASKASDDGDASPSPARLERTVTARTIGVG
jgi:hypothetical protein